MDDIGQNIEPGAIAIVGIAGRFPGARTPGELWRLLRDGREATQWLTDAELRAAGVSERERADPSYVRATLPLPEMEQFDAEFFGFSRRDAAILDPQHRHFLECAWEALEDAGHMPEAFGGAIGVFGGCGMQAYLPYNLLTNPELVQSTGLFLLRHTGNDKDFLCSRVSYLLDLKGPSVAVQTACSTSLVAVHMAAQSLLAGECDMALAGGVSIELPHRRGYRYAEGEILSPDGHCRAFDEHAAGTLFGSGAAVVVLRRLEDALSDGDNIHAVIRGSAVNNDGSRKAGYLAPSVDGQARAAAEALAVAGVPPASVGYVEAHGTGTPVGDPIEVAALAQAYGEGGTGFCGIGSLKTNIGHLDTAAGAAALIKVALAMRHELIPASLNFSRPNPRMDIERTPFRVVDQARPWPAGGTPRRAGVNSLGVGGTNAHVIVEEPPRVAGATAKDAGPQLFTFSARTPASLDRLKAKWTEYLADPAPDFNAADAAFTLQEGRRAFEHRCTVLASDAQELAHALAARQHPRVAIGTAPAESPSVVFMFPGGGAHYPGAGRELLSQPAFAQAVDECFRLMPADAPSDLRRIMFEADPAHAAVLEQPRYAIPALFVLEYALARLWQHWGVRPAAVIGHSAGEYAAACIAGVIGLADALAIVVLRGELFETAPAGAMLSVDLSEQDLRACISELPLDIAAVNAGDLCIASGSMAAIALLEARLAQRGAEARRLRIGVAAHSRLLDGVLARFRERLARIQFAAPTIPFVSTLTGGWADPALIATADYWVRHLREPVVFAQGMAALGGLPHPALVEIGPGQGLSALARQNGFGTGTAIVASTCKAQEAASDLALMLAGAGALWTRGQSLEWQAVRGPGPRRRISLPTYAFDHQRHWIDPGARTQAAEQLERAAEPAPPARLERLPLLDDWFRTPQWLPAPALAPAAPSGRWLVFGDDSTLARELPVQVSAAGGRVTLVRRGADFVRETDGSFRIAAADAEHYARLLRALEQDGALPDRVVHLWPLETSGLADRELAFDSLVHFAKALAQLELDDPMRLLVVTAASQSVRGEAVPHPERALALGPCRVIPAELQAVRARLVDLPREIDGAAAVRLVLQEALTDSDADFVAWRDGVRHAQQLAAPSADRAHPRRLRERGVYLITGGLGGIGLEVAAYLARTQRARLALVGRRSVPPKARWRAVAAGSDHSASARLVRRLLAIEQDGGEVMVLTADASDRRAMARALAECRARFGAPHGVFHAAGVLEDAPIALQTADSIGRVLGAKAGGAQVLHELLPPGQLDLFCVFSSTSVLLPSAGQVAYVAANAFLDALAAARPDGLAIRWGIWGDRGMAARAYGAHSPALEGLAVHPLLGVQVDSENGAAFEASYDSRRLWVLDEHRVGGRAVLPGTGYVEIASAAMQVLHPGAAVEIRSLSFEEAMVFEADAARVVRTELRRHGSAYEFTVRSRGLRDDRWLEHARASAAVFQGRALAQPAPAAGEWQAGAIAQEHAVAFGPRWHNLARMRFDAPAGCAELEIGAAFADDIGSYRAHPALTDMAATFGLHMLGERRGDGQVFVPVSIDRIRLLAPLPARLASRATLKPASPEQVAAFDISLHDARGDTLATFEGFTLRAVVPASLTGGSAAATDLIEEMLGCGIRAEDAPALLARVFASGARDLVVSSMSLDALRRAMVPARAAVVPRQERARPAGVGTRNPVEAVLADAWRELLGVDDVRADDDFFALGGHSLAAVRLFARVRKHFNVELPLATLFQAPTLGALAQLVAQHAQIETSVPDQAVAEAAPAKKSNVIPLKTRVWSPLVPICRGSDDRHPLFCVHGAGGNVLNFKIISDRLGAEQPFYGLQAQGVDGRLQPLTSVEAMASQYVEAIRAVDPHGPYQLAGYSAGGVIALEMAHQLQRDGARVSLLAMIDTLAPDAARRRLSYARKLWLMRHWSLAFLLGWAGRRRQGRRADGEYALGLERLARGEPLGPELLEQHLFRTFIAAQSRYEPPPFDGDMVLFRASDAETPYLAAGDALGWEAHVRGRIRVTKVPGSHFTIMSEPNVSLLIEGLRRELGLRSPLPQRPPAGGVTDALAASIAAERPA